MSVVIGQFWAAGISRDNGTELSGVRMFGSQYEFCFTSEKKKVGVWSVVARIQSNKLVKKPPPIFELVLELSVK